MIPYFLMLAIIGIPTFLLELLMNLLIKMFTTYTPRGFSSPATSGFYQKTSFVQSYICSRIWFLFTVAFSCFLWDNTQVLWGWTTPTGEVPRRWFLFTIDIGEVPSSPHVSNSPHSPPIPHKIPNYPHIASSNLVKLFCFKV